jgi:hypothetical protein
MLASMNPISLPDGSRLVDGFRKDPKAWYWQAPDVDGLLRALRACKSDYFAMNSLRGMVDGLGHPPDDETVLRRIAHDIRAGHLAWEFPAPPVPIQGDSGSTGTAQPQQKSESKPAPKSAPPPSPPPPKDAPPPPPKPSTPAPSKPVTAPPKSGPSGTTPKPPPVTPPKPPVVAPPVVEVAIALDFAGGAPARFSREQRLVCQHQWYLDPKRQGNTDPEDTIAENERKAECARRANPAQGSIRGDLFENEAIRTNVVKMQPERTAPYYLCKICRHEQEVDIVGAGRLGEAKSRNPGGNYESISDQAPFLISIHRWKYGPDIKPLAKLHKDYPTPEKFKESADAWKAAGWEVEAVPWNWP